MIDSANLRAVEAWARMRRGGAEPLRVDVLKARKERKIVCRLAGAGPACGDVIAKRCRIETGRLEQSLYDAILPALGVPSLRCLGVVEDEDDATLCWLFLEKAEGSRYSAALNEHRRLAGGWLALLHTSAPVAAAAGLPDRSIRHHRSHLDHALANVAANRANPALSPSHLAVIDAVGDTLALLDSRWTALARMCEAMPRVVVHGDFVQKNLRVRYDASGLALLCFDWGCAGRGNPAVDLAQAPASAPRFAASPDLESYWRVARDVWPRCELATVRRWAAAGNVFRGLAVLAWASRSLASRWVDGPVAELRLALDAIADAMHAAGRES